MLQVFGSELDGVFTTNMATDIVTAGLCQWKRCLHLLLSDFVD